MPRVLSFGFSSNPASPTDEQTATINWSAQTVSWPGVTNLPFANVDEAKGEIEAKASQNVADSRVDTEAKIYGPDGSTVALTVKAVGTPASGVTAVETGASSHPPARAQDLAAGLQAFVLDEIAP